MRFTVAILGLLALNTGSAFGGAGDFVSEPMYLQEFGIYCPSKTIGQEAAPETQRGAINLIEGRPRMIASTTVVPAELDISFGLRFRFDQQMEPAIAYVLVTHPPFGTPPVSAERYPVMVQSDDISLSQFSFDDAYEMELGTWIMQIELDGEIVIQKTFQVVPPEQSPFSIQLCEGPSLLS